MWLRGAATGWDPCAEGSPRAWRLFIVVLKPLLGRICMFIAFQGVPRWTTFASGMLQVQTNRVVCGYYPLPEMANANNLRAPVLRGRDAWHMDRLRQRPACLFAVAMFDTAQNPQTTHVVCVWTTQRSQVPHASTPETQ